MSERLLFLLNRVQHRLTTHVRRELKEQGLDLSKGQMGVLVVLHDGGEHTMGELRDELDIDRAALTRMVDKLESRGLVERRPDESDRRQVLIEATPRGASQAETVDRIFEAASRRIQQGLSEADVAAFRRVNVALLEKFE